MTQERNSYYAMLNGAKIAVTNCYGIWFEVRLRGLMFKVFRITRFALNLHQEAMPGMNAKLLARPGNHLCNLLLALLHLPPSQHHWS